MNLISQEVLDKMKELNLLRRELENAKQTVVNKETELAEAKARLDATEKNHNSLDMEISERLTASARGKDAL